MLFGLAVNDTQELYKEARLQQLIQQVKMTHFLENLMFFVIKKRFPECIKRYVLNIRKSHKQLILASDGCQKAPIPSILCSAVKQKVKEKR